ncbi:MAG: CRISPR-associated protein Csx11, partial [Anaerolineae bacterium]|nr:CRISPR-associated protein Csx11 [Anaerolineae bacterium]
MPNDLTILAQHRDALLLAEVAAWLHDMGKCTDEQIISAASDKPEGFSYKLKEAYLHLVDPSAQLSLLGEVVLLQDLIREARPGMRDNTKPWLVRTLGRCHGAAHVEKEEPPRGEGKQASTDTRPSTAFGREDNAVRELTVTLDTLPLNPLVSRLALKPVLRAAFSKALGDTRRPINEVTLWDWSSMVAALYKASVAGALLGHKPEPQDLQWRLLSIRVDHLEFLAQVTRIPDL